MKKRQRLAFIILLLFIVTLVIFYFIRGIRESLIFKNKERINIVFYGSVSNFYSIAKNRDVNYYLSLYPDLKVIIPGGYGNYRLGALGKLVSLEKKPDLIRKTFSSLAAGFVDLYFYQPTSSIYFGKKEDTDVTLPKIGQIFTMRTNGNIFDRLYVLTLFFGKVKLQFSQINNLPIAEDEVFLATEFAKKYQGYFYKTAYRNENHDVQIVYTKSYNTASLLTKIIEGEGIRVANLAQNEQSDKNCRIYCGSKTSPTAVQMAHFFNCSLSFLSSTEPYDIIFKMGSKAESEWLSEE